MISNIKYEGSTIVITGGAGAIGNTLVRRLLKHNPKRLIVIDNLTSGRLDFLPKDRIEFHNVDITNKEKLESVIPYDTNFIFHLAAHFANQNSVQFPYSDLQTNIIGTLNLLEICRDNGNLEDLDKFINCSSSCVYGNSELMSVDDKIYPHETPYAINKLAAELYTKFYAEHQHHLVPAVSIRIFNTYGPYELAGKFRNVIPNFIEKALNNDPIIITGTGEETRDFTYCIDTCRLFELAGLSDIRDGSVFNGGTGIKTKIKDLAKMIVNLCESKSEIIFKPKRSWDNINDRLSNIEESLKKLDYNPKYLNLEENLNETINWYKNQKRV